MKRIFFGPKGNVNRYDFFWKPWGFGMYFLRLLLFAALIVLLVWLISMFDKYERRDPILNPPVREGLIPPDTTTTVIRDIPNPGPALPPPSDNRTTPIEEDDIIDDENGRRIAKDKLGVIIDSDDSNDINRWAESFKTSYPDDEYRVAEYNQLTKLLRIEVPEAQREVVFNELNSKIPNINFKVFEDTILGIDVIPSDAAFGEEDYDWYFEPIQAYDAWDITMGNEDVVVAIVDSSFDLMHEELNGDRIYLPYSVMRNSGNVAPNQSDDVHGTMVASMAIGNGNNDRGLIGIASECKFMPVSLGVTKNISTYSILSGVLYAIYQGADVVNVSIGGTWDALAGMPLEEQIALSEIANLSEEDVWDYVYHIADERNVMIVWAAGNSNVYVGLDASKRNATTIRVSAVDRNMQKADFSNFGNIAELNVNDTSVSAPGVAIFGAIQNNSFNVGDGTSFSAPIVTGAVALMKSVNPELNNEEIIEIIKQSSKPIVGDTRIGGLLQIKNALELVQANME